MPRYVFGIDEVGRAAEKRAPPRFFIGIDEVGRGSLAGPVVVAAVAVPRGMRLKGEKMKRRGVEKLGRLKDSKKLTARRRERWAEYMKSHHRISYAIARVYPRGIDAQNISCAANEAALRAFRRLTSAFNFSLSNFVVRLDGGLFLGNEHMSASVRVRIGARTIRIDRRHNPRVSAFTVVKGDEKFNAVKLASIIAKVSRDWYMAKLHEQYPQYGFAAHKGYGTKAHFAALRKYGPSAAHRLTFLKKYHNL